MLDHITPVVLTLDEAANIARVLERLSWANDIVVVDSGSHDDTLAIVSRHRNARVFSRAFDNHASQWNFALRETGIRTDWVLALDADHVMTQALVDELAGLVPREETSGYRVGFTYCVFGRPLRASLYPPLVSLYRRERAQYVQEGHTQRLVIDGPVLTLRSRLLHDDRKSFRRWLRSQNDYMRLEASLIRSSTWRELSWSNRIRRFIVAAPIGAFLWCLFGKRTVLDGIPGICYSAQRMLAEFILSLHLIVRLIR